MREYLRQHTNPPVFLISGAVILLVLAFGVIFPTGFGNVASEVQGFIAGYFGWFYIFSVSFFLIFVVALMFTRWGNIRLGPDDSRPEFSNLSWFAMLFTAGMGIGLVYYGVAEPVSDFTGPPVGKGGTEAAAQDAMNFTFFHWLLHPWAIYIVLGLSLAYAAFRKGLPLKPASIFYPLIGDRIYGPVGHLIDILAVFGTVFGLATSLGLGAQQINSGLNTLFAVPDSVLVQILLIAGITGIAVVSLMLGVDRGIRRLAQINMWLAVVLTVFVFVVGPTFFILSSMAENTGYYLQNLLATSFRMYPFDSKGQEWQATWTLFYWGWWISWSPFVGMFIARISHGRTIRQFIAGTLFAPVGASAVWFTVFGNTALRSILEGNGGGLANADSSNALFVLLQQLPVAGIISGLFSVLAIVVVVLFFATSSDSGSLVVDMLTNGGDPNPIWQQRLFWAVVEGLVAAVLLAAGAASGGDALGALQTASITAGLPFCVVLLFMCYALVRNLQLEQVPAIAPDTEGGTRPAPEPGRAASRPQGVAAPQQASAENPQDRGPGSV